MKGQGKSGKSLVSAAAKKVKDEHKIGRIPIEPGVNIVKEEAEDLDASDEETKEPEKKV